MTALEQARALVEAGRAAEALPLIDGAPVSLERDVLRARALFLAERWAEAWRAYEVRFRLMEPPTLTRTGPDGAPVPLPRWREGPVPRRLVVFCEQGLGDTIQFCRHLPALAARCPEVQFLCDPRIVTLIEPVCDGIRVVRSAANGRIASADAWVPLLDLPHLLGVPPAAYGASVPYLAADPGRVARMRARLGSHGLKVGIVWQGNPKSPADGNRSAPLAAFAPLLGVPGVRLIALQKGPGLEQTRDVGFAEHLEVLGPDMDTGPDGFLDTAAAIAACDLVVSVCTGALHVAGAMGAPALVLLHETRADWRWLANRIDSPWYPSLRLVRAGRDGDWVRAAEAAAALIRAGDLPVRAAPAPG